MESYSRKPRLKLIAKSNSKIIYASFAIFIFLIIITTIVLLNRFVTNFLLSLTPQIIQQLQDNIGYKLSISNLKFNLLSGLYIQNIIFTDQDGHLGSIREVRFYLSLFSLFKKEIKISKLNIIDAELASRTVQENDKMISKFTNFSNLFSKLDSLKDFKLIFKPSTIYINNCRANLKKEGEEEKFIIINGKIYERRKNLICTGDIDPSNLDINLDIIKYTSLDIRNKKVNFYIEVVPFEDNLLIINSKFIIDEIKLIGSGIIYNFRKEPILDIKLISNPLNFIENVRLKSKYCIDGLLNVTDGLYGKTKSPGIETTLLSSYAYSPKNIFRIGDISCNVIITKNGINIKDLATVIDDRFPLFLNGTIKNLLEPEFDVEISSTLNRAILNITENFDLNLSLKVRKMEGFVTGKANLSFIREDKQHKKYFLTSLETKFEDLSLNIYPGNYSTKNGIANSLRVSIGKVEITEKALSEKNEPIIKEAVVLNGLNGDMIFAPGFWAIQNLICYGYDGVINAFGNINLTKKPYIYNLFLVFDNIDIGKLRRFYPINCNLQGKIGGRLLFQNEDIDYVKGIIKIDGAQLDSLEPLNKIADFLGINSIKYIVDANITTEFKSSKDGLNISRFDLTAEGMNLKSNFNLNKGNWIDGNISLSLLRNFLEESNKFHLLLNIAREKSSMIDFDFRISGFLGGLRLQLLEGEFRDKLMKKLSRSIQKKIEVEINKVIDILQSEDTVQ